MKKKSVLLYIIPVLAFILLFTACEGPEEEKDLSADDWIDKGLKLLGEGDGTGAYLAFSEALKIQEGNLDASYGVILADALQIKETLVLAGGLFGGDTTKLSTEELVDFCAVLDACGELAKRSLLFNECLGSQALGMNEDDALCVIAAGTDCDALSDCLDSLLRPTTADCRDACELFARCGLLSPVYMDTNDCVDACPDLYTTDQVDCFVETGQCELGLQNCFESYGESLIELIEAFWEPIATEQKDAMDRLLAEPEWDMEIPAFEFSLLGLYTFDLTGENDLGDVYANGALINAMNGIFELVFSLNFNLNFLTLENLDLDVAFLDDLDFENFDEADRASLKIFIGQLSELLGKMLKDPAYGDFLTLNEDGGKQRIQGASDYIGNIFGSLVNAIDWIDSETDPQWDDAIRYLDDNENNLWDEQEKLLVPGMGEFDKDLVIAMREILIRLKINFTDAVPFPVNALSGLLEYYGLDQYGFLLDLVTFLGKGEIDLADSLNHPTEEGLRPMVDELIVVLDALENAL